MPTLLVIRSVMPVPQFRSSHPTTTKSGAATTLDAQMTARSFSHFRHDCCTHYYPTPDHRLTVMYDTVDPETGSIRSDKHMFARM